MVGIKSATIGILTRFFRESYNVGDDNRVPLRVDLNRSRVPTDGNQAAQSRFDRFLSIEVDDRDCILSPVGHKQTFARLRKRQCVW